MWRRSTPVLAMLLMTACLSDAEPQDEQSSTTIAPATTTTTTSTSTSTTTARTSTTTGTSTSTRLPEQNDGQVTVLVFHKTEGFRHESIGAGIAALESIAADQGFTIGATEDAQSFVADLEEADVVVFLNTTGDILDDSQQAAMEEAMRSGTGFVGIHSATDTEYEWPWYGELVGAYFDRHPQPQDATITVTEPAHPTMSGIPTTFERFDEWYDFQDPPGPNVTVLAVVEEDTYDGGEMGDPHPIMWAHEVDRTRSFYTAFGHTNETFEEPVMLDLLVNAIRWTAGSG